jgi:hypothetical protein
LCSFRKETFLQIGKIFFGMKQNRMLHFFFRLENVDPSKRFLQNKSCLLMSKDKKKMLTLSQTTFTIWLDMGRYDINYVLRVRKTIRVTNYAIWFSRRRYELRIMIRQEKKGNTCCLLRNKFSIRIVNYGIRVPVNQIFVCCYE